MIQLRKALIGAGVLMAAGVAASAAGAAPGYVTSRTSLLAGPGGQYPVVARMGGGDRVEIFGCVRGWAFCDIAWEGYRGWARGAALQLFYRERRVSLYQYAPVIGIPFVSFSIGSYWGSHYHSQPWYNQAYRWGGPRFDNDRRDNVRHDNDRRDNDRRDGDRRDNDRPNMDRRGPNMGYQGSSGFQGSVQGNANQGSANVKVDRRNRSIDMQGNANFNANSNSAPQANQNNRRGGAWSNTGKQPNLPPQASDNNRRGGSNGGKCPPGQEKQGKCSD